VDWQADTLRFSTRGRTLNAALGKPVLGNKVINIVSPNRFVFTDDNWGRTFRIRKEIPFPSGVEGVLDPWIMAYACFLFFGPVWSVSYFQLRQQRKNNCWTRMAGGNNGALQWPRQ